MEEARKQRYREAVASMPQAERAVLLLSIFGLSYNQIAFALGMPTEEVLRQFARALAKCAASVP